MRNMLRSLLAAMAALALNACVSVLPTAAPAKPRFHITPANADGLTGEAFDWSLVIDDPHATQVYDTARIAVAPAPGRIEYLASAEWADRAPRLFQTAVVQTFEDAGRIIAVGGRIALPVGDIVLQSDIRRMELVVGNGQDRAVVSIYARLTDGKGTVYAAKKFEASSPASSSNPNDVYAAFDTAFNDVVTGIVRWSYDQGEQAHAAKGR